jgi:3-phosphoshikimate 1-carboxyvinyltransferase
LAAVTEILEKAGADFIEYQDGFEIRGNPDFVPQPSSFESYHDHRIAMSAAVLSLVAEDPSKITHAECTAISYPSFWDDVSLLTN